MENLEKNVDAVAPFLLFGIYNKIVKTQGND